MEKTQPSAQEKTQSSAQRPTVAANVPAAQSGQGPASLTPQNRALLIVLFTAEFLVSAENSQLNIALDAISGRYGVNLAIANYAVLLFAIVAGTAITCGTALLKRFGLRPLMFFGCWCSLAGSLLGLVAPAFPVLVLARMLQAVTAGLFFPLAATVVVAVAPVRRTGTLIAVDSAVIGVALAVSPLLSGLIMTYVGLRWVFVPTAVLAAAVLLAAHRWVHDVEPRQDRRVDVPSIVLALGGFAGFVLGLNSLAHRPWPSLAAMAVGTALMVWFVLRQRHLARPLLRLSPFRFPRYLLGEVAAELGFMSSVFMSLLIPLYLEGTVGWTPFGAGLLLAVPVLIYALGCYVGGRMEDKHGLWPLVPIAMGLLAVGLVGLWLSTRTPHVAAVGVCVGAAYLGVGLFFPALKAHDMDALPERLQPFGSSLHSVFGQMVSSVSSALFVGVMSGTVAADRAAGAAKAVAYASGFDLTLLIDMGIAAVALALGSAFAWHVRRRAA